MENMENMESAPCTPVEFPLQDERFANVEPSAQEVTEMCRRLGVTSKYGYSFVVYYGSRIITVSLNGDPVEDFISKVELPTITPSDEDIERVMVSVPDALRWFNSTYGSTHGTHSTYKAHDMTSMCV